jgi:hypothetical protein
MGMEDADDSGGKRIYFTPSNEVLQYIDQLKARGVHGKTRPQIVERLIGNEIERLIREGFLTLKRPAR